MANLNSLITIIMSVATFFQTKVALIIPVWSQRLLAAPDSCHQDPSFVLDLPVNETFTTTIFHTATIAVVSPGNELAIFKMTLPAATSTSLLAMVNEHTLVTIFFGILLLAAIIGFYTSSPPYMKPEDLVQLEAQIINKDIIMKEMRFTHSASQAPGSDRGGKQHRSISAIKDEGIHSLRLKVECSGNAELLARYESTQQVLDLEKEAGHLRTENKSLKGKLDAAGRLIESAVEANDKANAAEERIAAVRQHAQGVITQHVEEIKAQNDKVRIEQYRVQDPEKKVKDLKEEVLRGASLPKASISNPLSSTRIEKETRPRRVPPSAPGPCPAPFTSAAPVDGPEATPTTVPTAVTPAPLPTVPRRKKPANPFVGKAPTGQSRK
ncbi:hypothetical protein E4T42_00047 [Aureobasidium subglaciale]|nr:hypothetical protein E4T42_00047 [Aureobasidium subglaciale]